MTTVYNPSMAHIEGGYFHVFNRGVNRQPIFLNAENYLFLINRIKQYLPSYPVNLIAYCLMPNHYHFLFFVEQDDGLSSFLRRLFNSYSQTFNRQFHRTGTLFEGRAKSRLIDRDNYLLHIIRYIHLNPVKHGLVEHPEEWAYSNYNEFIGVQQVSSFNEDFLKTQFSSDQEYKIFAEDYLPTKNEIEIRKYLID